MQTGSEHHFSLSQEVDFSAAAYFTQLLAAKMLAHRLPFDVDILKVDIPQDATRETPWVLTRQSRQRYYTPRPAKRSLLSDRGPMGYEIKYRPEIWKRTVIYLPCWSRRKFLSHRSVWI